MGTTAKRAQARRLYGKGIWMRVKNPETLKTLRVMKGLTQGDLALMVRCTQQTISLLETGKMTTLSAALAGALAKKLGTPWESLFTLHESIAMPVVESGAYKTNQKVSA
ncbi:helix-turn-helix transcriptional regulator [Rhodococcus sp. Z13]|uniref:Helix-turn-helix transcriptional regulator n=1 Tax=Rhodococcus sacchari TaxID=2962047 RepID=A0ACD4DCQ9_9NOCA|nr:helix-turn-helix transcriptional regulator [Rhodococcus sp. Z13]UYP17764.1 helix-turn-helix transcriptional regulator [Rhodococcus sp. Z13]